MTLSALAKFFLPPAIAATAVFSAMTVPLAAIGDRQINIQFQEEPFFFGKLRDVATPYVVLATALSLGAGISAAAICGWRHSSRKTVEFQDQLSTLEKHLQEKDELLKELKQSESRLQITGLNSFLDDEAAFEGTASPKVFATNVSQPVVAQTSILIHEPTAKPVLQPTATQKTNENSTAATAAAAFASAQTFLGYTHTKTNNTKETAVLVEADKTSITPAEFEELQKQLREMMLQMQAMQNSLGGMPQATNAEVKAADKDRFHIHYDAPNTDEVRL